MKPEQAARQARQQPALDAQAKTIARLEKKLAAERAKTDIIIDAVTGSCVALKPRKFRPVKQPATSDEEAAVLVLSDLHFGEIVTADETMGQNRYSMAIATRRLAYMAERVARLTVLLRRMIPIPELHVLCLGDFATGEAIYQGQGFQIDTGAMDQAFQGGLLVAQAINQWSSLFPSVFVDTIAGNHGRPGPRGTHHPRTNWDTVLYRQIETHLRDNDRISIEHHDALVAMTKINGRKVGISHGHTLGRTASVETNMGRAAASWPRMLGTSLDLCVFGHQHTSACTDEGGTEVFANGSLIGGTSYGANKLRRINPPKQWFFGVHAHRITWRYAITCGK